VSRVSESVGESDASAIVWSEEHHLRASLGSSQLAVSAHPGTLAEKRRRLENRSRRKEYEARGIGQSAELNTSEIYAMRQRRSPLRRARGKAAKSTLPLERKDWRL